MFTGTMFTGLQVMKFFTVYNYVVRIGYPYRSFGYRHHPRANCAFTSRLGITYTYAVLYGTVILSRKEGY